MKHDIAREVFGVLRAPAIERSIRPNSHLDKQTGVRGAQYACGEYQKLLGQHGITPPMNRKGNCLDNAAVETFFKTIKAELLWQKSWPTRRAAEMAIFEYINGFYNPRRRHSAR